LRTSRKQILLAVAVSLGLGTSIDGANDHRPTRAASAMVE
jgi:hypothetical protein